jgi:hypothetical protein
VGRDPVTVMKTGGASRRFSASQIGRVAWWGAGGYSEPRDPNH